MYIRGECYCTEDPRHPGANAICDYRCFGDPTTFCGGEKESTLYYSVYGTGRYITTQTTLMSFETFNTRPKTPRAGSWSPWSAWRECSSGEDCVYTRTRACNNPTPLFGGRDCEGEAGYSPPSCPAVGVVFLA